VTLASGETFQHRHDAEGEHHVSVDSQTETARLSASSGADNRGCRGAYKLAFAFDGGMSSRVPGCQGDLVALDVLAEEAVEAREADGDASIHVPVPRDASEAAYRYDDSVLYPDWKNATELPWRWIPNATFFDAWGNEVEGSEVVFQLGQAEAETPAAVTTQRIRADLENRIRYEAGRVQPTSYTSGSAFARSSSLTGTTSEETWRISYDPDPRLLDCLMRNEIQGDRLPAGEPSEGFCAEAEPGEEMTWWTGELTEHRGLDAVPMYGVDDVDEPTRIVKTTWAHGIPHPVQAEFVEDDGDAKARTALNLTAIDSQGTPLAELGATEQPQRPRIDRGPLQPLEGPALDARERFPFPLDEAVDAARNDPTLTEFQKLLEEAPVLAVANLRPDDQGGETRQLRWQMTFTAEDETPVFVRCKRPVADSDAGTLSAPAADCDETAPEESGGFSTLSREDLESRSVTWDEALDRWAVMDPPNATEPVTTATYIPLLEEDVDASKFGTDGWLGVGADPGRGSPPVENEEAPTSVAIDSADGRTQMMQTGVREVGGLGPTEGQFAATSPPGPGAGDGLIPDTDAVVTATAGIGLLTLLAFAGVGLYSRLSPDEVLTHDTREQIRDLVEAEPGIHGNAIARRVDANERTVEHHVNILLREDVLTVLERGGYNHHFVNGEHTPKEMQALASLQRGQAEEIYETVRQTPGLNLSRLADKADVSKAYASKLVDELVDVGLVDRVRDGRSACLYANEV
jgi:DNA-binding transcriptional ArsR family regulator